MSSRCRICEWDTGFFNRRIARIEGSRLSLEELDPILKWCTARRIECLYFLADANCPETLATAEKAGFGFRDLRVTYEGKPLADPQPTESSLLIARPVRETDMESLTKIARSAHTDSRFFFDPHFDRERVAGLYEQWLRKACSDPDQIVFTNEQSGNPAGYLSCSIHDQTGQIGLVAIDSRFRNQGIGGALMRSALNWFAKQNVALVKVVTQGRNVAAQRFYQKHGFRLGLSQCWYHKWFV